MSKEFTSESRDRRVTKDEEGNDSHRCLSDEVEQDDEESAKINDWKFSIGMPQILANDFDMKFLMRQNDQMQEEIFLLFDKLEDQGCKSMAEADVEMLKRQNHQLKKTAKQLIKMAVRQSQNAKRRIQLTNKLVYIAKSMANKYHSATKILVTLEDKQKTIKGQFEELKRQNSLRYQQKTCKDAQLSTQFVEKCEEITQTDEESSDYLYSTIKNDVKSELIETATNSVQHQLVQTSRTRLGFDHFKIAFIYPQQTSKWEYHDIVPEVAFQDKNSHHKVASYLSQISNMTNEVKYDDEVIRNLEKIGQHNQVSKAFARLLREHQHLKSCLETLLRRADESSQIGNDRLIELYDNTISKRHKDQSLKKEQCIIF